MTVMILFLALSFGWSSTFSAQFKKITENTSEDTFPKTMNTKKSKSIIAVIVNLLLANGSSSKAKDKRITNNTYEDTFPQTMGGYVVWQARMAGNWEVFLYNANNKVGPTQITDNTYGDISPRTDGQYVTWAAGSAPNGEIFIYEIATTITTKITDNTAFDANPKIVNGLVVWESNPIGYTVEPGEIFLHDIANNTTTNVSGLVDPDNDFDDHSSRFDGQRVFWIQDDSLGNSVPFVHDLVTGTTLPAPGGFSWQDTPQVDGDLLTFTRVIGSDREIILRDRKGQHSSQITDNNIEDTQPCISGNILAWVGGRGDNREIYVYAMP